MGWIGWERERERRCGPPWQTQNDNKGRRSGGGGGRRNGFAWDGSEAEDFSPGGRFRTSHFKRGEDCGI